MSESDEGERERVEEIREFYEAVAAGEISLSTESAVEDVAYLLDALQRERPEGGEPDAWGLVIEGELRDAHPDRKQMEYAKNPDEKIVPLDLRTQERPEEDCHVWPDGWEDAPHPSICKRCGFVLTSWDRPPTTRERTND